MSKPSNLVRIATRQSPLALWQAEFIRAELLRLHPDFTIELVTFTTQGDKILDTPLAKIGGKGLFVKELEVALLQGEADMAVHSMKDVPMEFPAGLCLPVICERENPTDAFVSNHYEGIADLPPGAVVGTSSLRRQCQLLALRPDITIQSLRGNVNTRLRKLDEGEFDAILLASSGLIRLGFEHRITALLSPETILPAGGQGALGIEIREGDHRIASLIAPLHHAETASRVLAERAMNRRLEGGCQVPIGCYAELLGDQVRLRGLVGALSGEFLLRDELTGPMEMAEQIGISLAERLLAQGADEILRAVYERAQHDIS